MNNNMVRLLRGYTGLSQKELGSLLGKHQSTIAKYEKGSLLITKVTAEKLEEMVKSEGLSDIDFFLLKEIILSHSKKKVVKQ